MSKTISIDESLTVIPGVYISFSGQFALGDTDEHPLIQPAAATLRFNRDSADILTGEITLPSTCDLSAAHGVGYTPPLEPCPFCCADDMLVWDAGRLFGGRWLNAVVCGGCGTQGPVAELESAAVDLWNRTHSPRHKRQSEGGEP